MYKKQQLPSLCAFVFVLIEVNLSDWGFFLLINNFLLDFKNEWSITIKSLKLCWKKLGDKKSYFLQSSVFFSSAETYFYFVVIFLKSHSGCIIRILSIKHNKTSNGIFTHYTPRKNKYCLIEEFQGVPEGPKFQGDPRGSKGFLEPPVELRGFNGPLKPPQIRPCQDPIPDMKPRNGLNFIFTSNWYHYIQRYFLKTRFSLCMLYRRNAAIGKDWNLVFMDNSLYLIISQQFLKWSTKKTSKKWCS